MVKKFFLTLCCCLFSASLLSAQSWEASEEASYHSSIVKISGDGYSGSGTVIKFIEDSEKEGYYIGWILTASHVINTKDTIFEIFFNDGRKTENGTVIIKRAISDGFDDLAIVKALIPDDIIPMEISTEDVDIEENVELCGFGSVDFRHWIAKYGGKAMGNGGHIIFSWAIQGDSGGPIIHNGKVVGVICFGTGIKRYKDTGRVIVGPIYGSNIERIAQSIKSGSQI